MGFDGARADEEAAGDLCVGVAFGAQVQDFQLARRQRVVAVKRFIGAGFCAQVPILRFRRKLSRKALRDRLGAQ